MRYLWIPPSLFFTCLILIVLFYFTLPAYNILPFPYNLAGVAISFLGFTIMGKSNDLFRKHKTTKDFGDSSNLITEGIYLRTRNPMYLGMFLMLAGMGIAFRNTFSLLTPFLFFLVSHFLYIPKEEKLLAKTFGEQYLEYKKKVRKWI